MNNFFGEMFKKLKSIKHIEILLAVLIALIVLLVYFSGSTSTSKQTTTTSTTSASVYTREVETKLENILSKISGAGEVSVMVMLANKTELETTTLPDISSVVVVATGAKNVKVKLDLIKAVESLLSISASSIEVLEGG